MIKDKQSALSIGTTCLFYGTLLLLNLFKFLNFLNQDFKRELLDWRSVFIYAAISFLIFKSNKIWGLCLVILSLVLRFTAVNKFIASYDYMIIPASFIIVGLVLLFSSLKK